MKFALVVSGSPGKLLYINQSAINVTKYLNQYSQFKAHYEPLEDRSTLSDYLSTLQDDIDEFIFYYIGHGDVNYGDDDKFEFEITHTQQDNLETIISIINKKINPKKIFIIVDACKSGKILSDLHSSKLQNTFLLASCSKTELSYECQTTLKSTRFSSFFCSAIKNAKTSLDFYQIEKLIKKDFESIDISEKQTVDKGDYKSLGSTLLKKDIKIEHPPEDQKLFLTIQLDPLEKDQFTIIIWAKSDDGSYIKNIDSNDEKSLHKNKIASHIDNCIENQYSNISSNNIYLIFVIPVTLMTENINTWKLNCGQELGQRYTVVTRSLERFTSEGINFKKGWYRHVDWDRNWQNCQQKSAETLSLITHSISNNSQALNISSQRAERTPLIVLNYDIDSDSFLSLYKSHISVAMWVNGCKDYEQFEALLEKPTIKEKEFGKLLDDFFEFKPNETGLDGNIMLLYDNPNDLPPDEVKKIKAQVPIGE